MTQPHDINLHDTLTIALAKKLRLRGDTRKAAIERAKTTWDQTRGATVTERKEEVRQNCYDLHALIADLDGEIDALRAEIRHVELAGWGLIIEDLQEA